MKRQLLIGSGNRRQLDLGVAEDLVTLDIDPECGADCLHDLDVFPYPFEDNEFDEVYGYEVLEHCGEQGDWRYFFAQFGEFWRILKPGGFLVCSTPGVKSVWTWGDPGHRRVIGPECLVFLSQAEYVRQVGRTPMTDYRAVWKCDFETVMSEVLPDKFLFVLKANK